tara:strand:- start:928 stop:1761 length:834 start_codon:yes stop_codon:yes gene_type:complete
MEYIEVDIRLKEVTPYSEILIARLNEIEFESFYEYDYGLKGYVQTQLLDKDKLKNIISEISEQTELSFTLHKLKQKNWNAHWESNYLPVSINENCVIRADFHNAISDVKYEIIITPKMSFGTGHHQTTSLVMNKMFDLEFKGRSVLDVGCGTGILSVLASKLGAIDIVALDIDNWAFENAQENATLNNISDIHFVYGNISSVINRKYDIILANINRNTILNDLTFYSEAMYDYSDIILSGFLEKDVSVILKESAKFGLELVVSKNKEKWQMLHLRRS